MINEKSKFTRLGSQQVEVISWWLEDYSSLLSNWEVDFLNSVLSYNQYSDKQYEVLKRIRIKINSLLSKQEVK